MVEYHTEYIMSKLIPASDLATLKEQIKQLATMVDMSVDYGEKYGKYAMKISSVRLMDFIYGVNTRTQRKYLFKDVVGGNGHEWQRNLFATLILRQPLPQLELSANLDEYDNVKFLIQDGQQRYRTLAAIFNDCVKLPKGIEKFGDQYIGLGNKSYSQLPQKFQEMIGEFPLEFLVSFGLTEEEEYNRFILINNGTPLSKQDRRSAQVSEGAAYIQSIVDGEPEVHFGWANPTLTAPKFRMFEISMNPKSTEHTYIKVSPFGRSAEEVVAHWFNSTFHNQIQIISQDSLDRLYKKFENNASIPSDELKTRFHRYLATLDKTIVSHNRRKEIEGRVFLFSFFVLRRFLDAKIKVDNKSFISDYLTAIASLKKANKPWNPQGPVDDPSVNQKYTRLFTELFRTGSFDYQIERVVSEIFNTMVTRMKMAKTFIVQDSNREFTDDDKRIRYAEQSGKCGYCAKDISFQEGVCDHKMPHTEGGLTDLDNLVVSCEKCNRLKGSLPFDAWLTIVEQGVLFEKHVELT